MELATSLAEELERQVARLAVAESPSEALRLVLEGSRVAVPRAAVFLLKQGRIKGWGCVGYDAQTAGLQRAFSSPSDTGWLGEVAAAGPGLHRRMASGAEPDFGQPASSEAAAITVRVKSKVIAILLAERSDHQTPWNPALLGILVHVAQLRLHLGLALRKLRPAEATSAAPAQPAAAPQKATADAKELSPVPPADPGGDEVRLAAARRFARLVATDVRLYNEEAVMQGRRNGDLAERLGEQLVRGRETFMRRHADLGGAALTILREAYVDVLAGGNEELIPASALEPGSG